MPTYEDTYTLSITADKNAQEKVRIYEIGGKNTSIGQHFVNSSDAFILVFDLTDFESFTVLKEIKAKVGFFALIFLREIVLFILKFHVPIVARFY